MESPSVSSEPARHGGQSEPHKSLVPQSKISTFLICTFGGLALLAIASLVQGISFGFAKLSLLSLGIPFVLGFGGSFVVLQLIRRKLLELGGKLDLEFAQRTQDLKSSAERFQLYAEVASDWFWETNKENRFVFFSSHLFDATGAKPEDLLGQRREEFRIDSGDPIEEEQWDHYLRCLEQRLPFMDFDYRARLPNGKERIIRTSGKPYFDSEGEFAGYRGSGSDVTDTLEEQKSQKRAHDLIYNATALLKDGFLLFDADDRLMICNDRYRQLYAEIEDKLEPGVTFTEIAQAYAETQNFDTAEAKQKWIEERVDKHRNPVAAFDQQLEDGSWVRVIDQKLPDGGFVGLRVDITEAKRIEDELERAQRIARVGSYRWNVARQEIGDCSAEFARIHGLAPEQARGMSGAAIDEMVYPDDLERITQIYTRADLTGEGYEMEYRIVRTDGEIRNIIEWGTPGSMRGGKVIEQFCTLQDVTEIRRAEAELDEAQRIAGVGSFRWDVENDRMISCSREFERSFASMEDLMTSPWDRYAKTIYPEDMDKVKEAYRLSDNSATVTEVEYRMVSPDGNLKHVIERLAPSVTRDGKIVEQIGTMQDVTASRLTEAELRQVQLIARVGSYRWDVEKDEVISASEEFGRILGLSLVDNGYGLKFDQLHRLVHPEDRQRVLESYTNAADGEYEASYRIVHPDGEILHVIERGGYFYVARRQGCRAAGRPAGCNRVHAGGGRARASAAHCQGR